MYLSNETNMQVIYEDNHLIAVSKTCHEIVQGDKTGDPSLADELREWIREKYAKPGNVFVGVVHRLDRPVTGAVVFAKTSKGLVRMNALFRDGGVRKTYWAIVRQRPSEPEGVLVDWLWRNERQNKSYVCKSDRPGARRAELHYRLLASSDRYHLLEIDLRTGRHHQIRCQLAHMGCSIKGDLKYGAERSNPDGGISLHARRIAFTHPVSGRSVEIVAPVPAGDALWKALSEGMM